MSWPQIKFGVEDAEQELNEMIEAAGQLREQDDPDDKNAWMRDIVSHLTLAAEELRSAYAKVALL